MKTIALLYVGNVISRRDSGDVRQNLSFVIAIRNLAYEKQVEVRWAGEDDVWHNLKAQYHFSLSSHLEVWRAEVSIQIHHEQESLPGDIHFAIHASIGGHDFWDNNNGRNYEINADSGIRVAEGIPLLPIEIEPLLQPNQPFLPITVAVNHPHLAQAVFVRWTHDHWRTETTTPCYFKRKHWDKAHHSNARNPNRYGCAIWISHIPVADAYRVEYAVGFETRRKIVWANNEGRNYAARHARLKVLTLNLHCYQEPEQDRKLSLIAQAINELDVDIVCLQEVAENWNDGRGDWNSNAAKIIRERLSRPYHLHFDYSHIGFGQYREGSAILSRHAFTQQDSAYVSSSRNPQSIHARRVVMGSVNVPYMGPVNVFSTHLSWWSDGFREQFEKLRHWAGEKHSQETAATLLCGDFNCAPGSEGYRLATASGEYRDQYLKATQPRTGESMDISPAVPAPANELRIDHVLLKRESNLEVHAARELFTEADYGRVSDHPGYYFEFEPR